MVDPAGLPAAQLMAGADGSDLSNQMVPWASGELGFASTAYRSPDEKRKRIIAAGHWPPRAEDPEQEDTW